MFYLMYKNVMKTLYNKKHKTQPEECIAFMYVALMLVAVNIFAR
jgi:hypothetical protein